MQVYTTLFLKQPSQLQLQSTMVKKIINQLPQPSLTARKVSNEFIKTMLIRKTQITKKNTKFLTKQTLKTIVKEDMMTCPLCLQIMVTPVVTECGHHYCLMCIQDYFLNASKNRNDPRCSICRNHLEFYDYHQSLPLKIIIEEYMQKFDKTTREAYKIRQRDSDMEEERRIFKLFQVGIYLDFFDCNIGQWRHGVVVSIFINNQGHVMVTIRSFNYDGQESRYYRFPGNSKKLASPHYFTKYYDEQDSDSDSQEEEQP